MQEYMLKTTHPHAEDLHDGRMVGPGEKVRLTKEEAGHPHNLRLIEDEALVPSDGKDPQILEGKTLRDRGKKLDIQGAATMQVADLRAAIADKEAEEALREEARKLEIDGYESRPLEDLRTEIAQRQATGGDNS